MKCGRAHQILLALSRGVVEGDARELGELEKHGLVLGLDGPSLEALGRYQTLIDRHPDSFAGAPQQIEALGALIAELDRRLRSEWHRRWAKPEELAREEDDRVWAKRLRGLLLTPRAAALLGETSRHRAGAASPAAGRHDLGATTYALTNDGLAALAALGPRLPRYGPYEVGAFLKPFRKATSKMGAFAAQAGQLRQGVGDVPKGREQVLATLLKAGLSPAQVAAGYRRAFEGARGLTPHDPKGKTIPHVAALLLRNAAEGRHHDVARSARALARARTAMLQAGHPGSPVALGAAKALLAYDPPEAGLPRFNELVRWLGQFAPGERAYKLVVRLMPARGEPAELVGRAARLAAQPRLAQGGRSTPVHDVAVALVAMTPDDREADELVGRYADVAAAFAARGVQGARASELALACLGCPGAPAEIVALVFELAHALGPGPGPGDEALALAASFARRFAY